MAGFVPVAVVVFFAGVFVVPEVADCDEVDGAGFEAVLAGVSCAAHGLRRSVPAAINGNKLAVSDLCIGIHCPIPREDGQTRCHRRVIALAMICWFPGFG